MLELRSSIHSLYITGRMQKPSSDCHIYFKQKQYLFLQSVKMKHVGSKAPSVSEGNEKSSFIPRVRRELNYKFSTGEDGTILCQVA